MNRYREAVTTDPAPSGDQIMATLAKLAADRFGDSTAARFLSDGAWTQMTYNELWERVRDLALGFVELGVGLGDRVAILSNTRIEFTVANLAACSAGAIVVPVYPSSSPEECEWVIGNSGSKVVVCEDANQVAKIDVVRGNLGGVGARRRDRRRSRRLGDDGAGRPPSVETATRRNSTSAPVRSASRMPA